MDSTHSPSVAPVRLTGQGIFTLVIVLLFAAGAVNCPLDIPVPLPHAPGSPSVWTHLPLGVVTAPLAGAVILSVAQVLRGDAWRSAVVGWGTGIAPWDVLALFFALAYMAVSVEASGLFRAAAVWVVRMAGPDAGGGARSPRTRSSSTLFVGLYIFWWVLGAIAGNDAVIISGSSFVVHLTRSSAMSRTWSHACAWSQFTAANIASAVLVSGNPTNLVVSQSFDLSFALYSAHMVLPSLAAAVAALAPILVIGSVPWLTPREARGGASGLVDQEPARAGDAGLPMHITKTATTTTTITTTATTTTATTDAVRNSSQLPPPSPLASPSPSLCPENRADTKAGRQDSVPDVPTSGGAIPQVDIQAAIVSSCILVATLGALIGTSVVGADVHVTYIAGPGAAICLIRDMAADCAYQRRLKRREMARSARVHKLASLSKTTNAGPTVQPSLQFASVPPNRASGENLQEETSAATAAGPSTFSPLGLGPDLPRENPHAAFADAWLPGSKSMDVVELAAWPLSHQTDSMGTHLSKGQIHLPESPGYFQAPAGNVLPQQPALSARNSSRAPTRSRTPVNMYSSSEQAHEGSGQQSATNKMGNISRCMRRFMSHLGQKCNRWSWHAVGPVVQSRPGQWVAHTWKEWGSACAPRRVALARRWPRTSSVLARQPWTLLPFAYGMFVLVSALRQARVVDLLGEGLGKAVSRGLVMQGKRQYEPVASTSSSLPSSQLGQPAAFYPLRMVVGASMLMGTICAILCNLAGTNIGATLLLVQALQSEQYHARVQPAWMGPTPAQGLDRVNRAAQYGVALGANVGALAGTQAASLAGLLWTQALAHENVRVSRRQFAVYGLVTFPLALVTGVAVVVACVMF